MIGNRKETERYVKKQKQTEREKRECKRWTRVKEQEN
jgi:hypothetical protein